MAEDEIGDITYANSGVDLIAARGTTAKIKAAFKEQNIDMKGHFGGAVSLRGYKSDHSVHIGIEGTPIQELKDSFETGKFAAYIGLNGPISRNAHMFTQLFTLLLNLFFIHGVVSCFYRFQFFAVPHF